MNNERAPLDLAAIEARVKRLNTTYCESNNFAWDVLLDEDLPALLTEVRRLTAVADAAREYVAATAPGFMVGDNVERHRTFNALIAAVDALDAGRD